MKKIKFIIWFILFVALTACQPQTKKTTDKNGLNGKITISGAFALYPLTVEWAEEFKKMYPGVLIDISAGGAGKGMADVLNGMVDLAMFSREVMPEEVEKGAWSVAVAKDAVFPTINSASPVIKEVLNKGITRNHFAELFTSKTNQDWNKFLDLKNNVSIHVFTRSDACGAGATWADYFGKQQEDLFGAGVFGDPGIADAVMKDPLGIGYNNLVYLFDLKTGKCIDGLKIIPLDINENRKIDEEENFYNSLDEVISAIQEGRYPSPPARNLYLISKNKPANPAVQEFLRYILKSGQPLLIKAGYIQLDSTVLQDQLLKISL